MKDTCIFRRKFFLFLVFVFILTGSNFIIASAGTVDDKLAQIQKMYPNGSYFTVNGQPCTSHGSYGTCNNCELTHILQARHPEMYGKLTGQAWTCLAFAKFSFYYLFGHTASTNVKQVSLAEARPGDFVSFMDENGNEKHYAIIIDSKNKIVMDGNYSKLCVVTHYNSGPFIQYPRYEILRSLNYDKVNNSDTTKPTITNARVTNITKNGYTVTCTVSDNVGVTKVLMPTWTVNNGQDDLPPVDKWPKAAINGNTATYTVSRADHNNESGTYITDIYAYDAAGNESEYVRVSANLSNQLPTGEITYAGSTEKMISSYCVKGTAVDLDDKSKPVEIEIYELESNGKERFATSEKTDPTTHIFETAGIMPEEQGNKTIRVYALDCQTGEKVLLGTKNFHLKTIAKKIDISVDNVDVRCGETITLTITTDPVDAEEAFSVWYDKENAFVAPKIDGHTLEIKGLKKGKTTIEVIGEWASDSLTINVIDSVCSHKYTTVVEREATCNTTGLSYEQCSICGEKKEGSEKIIPTTGHVKNENSQFAGGIISYGNCVYASYSQDICLYCGAYFNKKVGEKYTNHMSYTRVIGQEATCSEEGYTYEKCNFCGIEKPDSRIAIPATGNHTYITVTLQEPTCDATGSVYEKCSACGIKKEGSDKEIPATGAHSFGDWVEIKHPTTVAEGIKLRTCSVCKKTEQATIAKLASTEQNAGDNQTDVPKTEKTGKSMKTVKIKLNARKEVTLKKEKQLKIQVKAIW